MARRNRDGSHAHSRAAKAGGREEQGGKRVTTKHGEQTHGADIGPDPNQIARPAIEEPVDSEAVVDEQHVHDVTTGQRRVVVLPADLCRRLSIREGTPLRLVEHESHFEVIPMRLVPATEGTSYDLGSLLAGVTPENIHGEVDTGPAVGQESW